MEKKPPGMLYFKMYKSQLAVYGSGFRDSAGWHDRTCLPVAQGWPQTRIQHRDRLLSSV